MGRFVPPAICGFAGEISNLQVGGRAWDDICCLCRGKSARGHCDFAAGHQGRDAHPRHTSHRCALAPVALLLPSPMAQPNQPMCSLGTGTACTPQASPCWPAAPCTARVGGVGSWELGGQEG